jgi:hypothetical protein
MADRDAREVCRDLGIRPSYLVTAIIGGESRITF